jgi:hypothetical protein
MFYKTCKFTILLFLAFFTTFLSGQNSKSDEISEKIYEFSNFDTLENILYFINHFQKIKLKL